MSNYRVILQPGAEQDIASIYAWIFEHSPAGANRWHQKLAESVAKLRLNAVRYPEAPESDRFDETIRNLTFRMPSGKVYRLLFTISSDEVHVLFVRGPGQDWVTP